MTVLDHHYVDIALVRAFEELTGQTVNLSSHESDGYTTSNGLKGYFGA